MVSTVPPAVTAAIAGLVDTCVRSPHFLAVEMLAAAQVLRSCRPLATQPAATDPTTLLCDAPAVAALASALASVVKRATACIKAAGTAQAAAGAPPDKSSDADRHAASLVVLADAMEAAAATAGSTPAQLFARSVILQPAFTVGSFNGQIQES
ncbi:hypothetical protein OEZ86_010062 [Tetradesmus obliquus]|uniref:Uncharacterized protein n=1 Tax=Tetradesmus obliquus TaxID=3088 RepID=A0ABY8UNN6_TETOB|nr:hypothetical protein OEZ85_001497 [Tetradesmus obliquus]WIA43620.1 hypothetical protein OEZ86_010062 [Tetradesmus obliquus]